MVVERNSVRAAGLLPRGRLGRLLGLPQRLAFTFERDKVAGVVVAFPVRRLLRGVPEQKRKCYHLVRQVRPVVAIWHRDVWSIFGNHHSTFFLPKLRSYSAILTQIAWLGIFPNETR